MVAPHRPPDTISTNARPLRAARRRLATIFWSHRQAAPAATPAIRVWQAILFVAWCLTVCAFYVAGLTNSLP